MLHKIKQISKDRPRPAGVIRYPGEIVEMPGLSRRYIRDARPARVYDRAGLKNKPVKVERAPVLLC